MNANPVISRENLRSALVGLALVITIISMLLLSSCSSPFGGPDAFDQALGQLMAQRAAASQARMERSVR